MSTRHSVANNANRFSLIVATTVASLQPKNEKRRINVPMEVLLSAMLVRRTERADGSTRQLEHRLEVGVACRKECVLKRKRLQDRAT